MMDAVLDPMPPAKLMYSFPSGTAPFTSHSAYSLMKNLPLFRSKNAKHKEKHKTIPELLLSLIVYAFLTNRKSQFYFKCPLT